MFDAAKADGVTLYAHSGYRSYRTQKTMYSNRLKRNNGTDALRGQGKKQNSHDFTAKTA